MSSIVTIAMTILTTKGGLNLLDLKFDPENPENRAHWEDVFQRVEAGEMPPKKKRRPNSEAMAGFLKKLEAPLIEVGRRELSKMGRVHARRLTAREYENSLHDLLGIDIPLAGELTADVDEGFTTNAETQQISHFHLDNYLRVSAQALDEAFTRALEGDKQFHREYLAKDITNYGGGNNRVSPALERQSNLLAFPDAICGSYYQDSRARPRLVSDHDS